MASGVLAMRMRQATTPGELSRLVHEAKGRWYDIAKAARDEAVKPLASREAGMSEKTAEDYARDAKRAEAAGWNLEKVAHSAASFNKVRAAAKLALAKRIREVLREADQVEASAKAKGEMADMATARKLLLYESRELDRLLAQYVSVSGSKWSEKKEAALAVKSAKVAAAKAVPELRKVARSCRQRPKLGRLGDDWRARMWERMSPGKYRSAVAVAILFGVRPAELQKGVRVFFKDGQIAVRVEGAKVKERGNGKASGRSVGQEWREFCLTREAASVPAAFDFLAAKAAGKVVKVSSDAKAFGSTFRAASRREFGPALAPSAYALRHAFSADMKAAGEGGERLAAMMGHASERSQAHYGQRQQGRSMTAPAGAVRAASPVRKGGRAAAPPSRSRVGQWSKVNSARGSAPRPPR